MEKVNYKHFDITICADSISKSGNNGTIIHGIMSDRENSGNNASIVLKTYKQEQLEELPTSIRQKRQTIEENKKKQERNDRRIQSFKNEKEIVEELQKKDIKYFCRYYGTAEIDGKEYIIMEDLSSKGYKTLLELKMEIEQEMKTINFKKVFYTNLIKQIHIKANEIIKTLYETYKMVHNDIHSGNILFKDKGSKGIKIKLVDCANTIFDGDNSGIMVDKQNLKFNISDLDKSIAEIQNAIDGNDTYVDLVQ